MAPRRRFPHRGREDDAVVVPEELRKPAFLSHLYIKTIILPRQAQDKHRETIKQRCRFSHLDAAETAAVLHQEAVRRERSSERAPPLAQQVDAGDAALRTRRERRDQRRLRLAQRQPHVRQPQGAAVVPAVATHPDNQPACLVELNHLRRKKQTQPRVFFERFLYVCPEPVLAEC
jgi:hypothetical protein